MNESNGCSFTLALESASGDIPGKSFVVDYSDDVLIVKELESARKYNKIDPYRLIESAYGHPDSGIDGVIAQMNEDLNKARETIDRLKSAGDKMAESLDRQSDMMESDGADMRGQRELTKRWRDSKNT